MCILYCVREERCKRLYGCVYCVDELVKKYICLSSIVFSGRNRRCHGNAAISNMNIFISELSILRRYHIRTISLYSSKDIPRCMLSTCCSRRISHGHKKEREKERWNRTKMEEINEK